MTEISNRSELNTWRAEPLEKAAIGICKIKSVIGKEQPEHAATVSPKIKNAGAYARRVERWGGFEKSASGSKSDIVKIGSRVSEQKPKTWPFLPNLASLSEKISEPSAGSKICFRRERLTLLKSRMRGQLEKCRMFSKWRGRTYGIYNREIDCVRYFDAPTKIYPNPMVSRKGEMARGRVRKAINR